MTDNRVTSLDVARVAGLSQSAVSRVFTPGASASPKTVEKVRKVAKDLGYRPNVLARAMVSGRSRIIGLVVAYLDNLFYPDALEKLSTRLQEKGYHVLIFMASQTAGNIDRVMDEILDYQVDGIVTASVAMSSDLAARCQLAGVPIVLFNRTQPDENLSAVASDNFKGGQLAAQHLLTLGHTNIGYLAGWEGASTQREREAGFLAGLQAAGVICRHREVGSFRMDQAQLATRRMFQADTPPTAIFAANDHMAIAVMDVLRSELGLAVPSDVSVIGFDDVSMAGWPAYDLTTIRQQADKMVDQTIALLLSLIENESAPAKRITLDAPLIQRGSTGPVKEII